jgi:hypothetical protein
MSFIKMYHNIPIHIFLTTCGRTSKTFTLKLIIQGLLRIYNKKNSWNLTQIKKLFMASTCKVAFSIDGQTIHSKLNIPIQQTLTNLSKLSSIFLNRLTCWYEHLQLVIIDEIFLVGAKMFNVIYYQLKGIIYTQNKFFNVLDVIMSCDFYQTLPIKDCWIFYSLNDSINSLTPNFWKNNVQNVMN